MGGRVRSNQNVGRRRRVVSVLARLNTATVDRRLASGLAVAGALPGAVLGLQRTPGPAGLVPVLWLIVALGLLVGWSSGASP
jgi:hypothetical protein